jgi:mRNA interferase MazF
MALKYHPKPGEILLCNYNTGFIVPEMTKLRPVVIISPRLRKRDDLVAVVPLSTTRPDPIELHHCEINLKTVLPSPYEAPTMWAKCDMLETPQLTSIRKAILCGLGMASLTVHL